MAPSKVELTLPCVGYAAHDKSGKLTRYNFKRRELRPKDIKFDVKYCGICHTDLHQIHNDWGNGIFPMVPGHEMVGVVTEVGSEVKKFEVGDHIGVGCMVNSCKECSSCDDGLENYCLDRLVWSYSDTDHDGTTTYGGYSNIMVIVEDFALKIDKDLPLDSTAPLLCAGITIYSPMRHYGMCTAGKKFGVVGLGGLGHVAVLMGKAFGMHVTVISTSSKKEKEALECLHADAFLVSKDNEQMKKAAKSLDYIIDTVSAAHPMDMYLDLLKINGKLVIIGLPPTKLEISPTALINGRRTLGGSLIGGIGETQEMLDFCAEHKIKCEIETVPIDYVNDAMVRLKNSDVHYRFVIDIANSLKAD